MELVIEEKHLDFPIVDKDQIGAFRRAVHVKAMQLGFDEKGIAKIELVGTELATNLTKHSQQGGEILFKGIRDGDNKGIELISLDNGPGIPFADEMLKDGVSTAKTLGFGLGTIKRLSNQVDIYTNANGTAMLCRLWARTVVPAPAQHRFEVGGLMVALSGETACGDGWATANGGSKLLVAVIDGLGHGGNAQAATESAFSELSKHLFMPPEALIVEINNNIRRSVGAVLAIAVIDRIDNTVTYSGIGNISAYINSGNETTSGCASMEGIVGYKIDHVRQFKYAWTEKATLVIGSDGMGRYAQRINELNCCRPALAAAVLYRDFVSRRDDATIVVVRNAYANNTSAN